MNGVLPASKAFQEHMIYPRFGNCVRGNGDAKVHTNKKLLVWLILFCSFLFVADRANAQLAPGCSCPPGATLVGNICFSGGISVNPICTGSGASGSQFISQNVRSVAASQQQFSFSGIQTILDGKRDQLQNGRSVAAPSGYAEEDSPQILGYANSNKASNAFASMPMKALPPVASAGPAWASWIEGFGDWQRNSALSVGDLTHSTDTYGAQGGVDATWQALSSADDALILGVVASWMTSRVTFDNSPVSMRLKGPGIGLYGSYLRGNFSVDLAVKEDFLGLDEDFAGLVPNASVNANNFGVTGNAQYKINTGVSSFVEPTGGFSFTRTSFENGAAALDLKDASTLRLQAGVRFGTSFTVAGTTVEPTFKVLAYDNVVAQGSSITADTPGAAIVPTDQGQVRGELDPEINFDLGNSWSTNLSGQFRFGDELVGGAVRAQLRKQW